MLKNGLKVLVQKLFKKNILWKNDKAVNFVDSFFIFLIKIMSKLF